MTIAYPGLSGLSFLNGDGVSTSGSRNCGERGSDESEISERGFRAKFMIKGTIPSSPPRILGVFLNFHFLKAILRSKESALELYLVMQ